METKNNPSIKDATLLDDFAGKAMQAIITSPHEIDSLHEVAKEYNLRPNEMLAKTSYSLAKLMLKERAKHNKD